MSVIDLNADLGESYGVWRLGDDEAMLDLVTSANVACGFHGGDPLTLTRTCAAAAARGVVIGAQVSYRDLAGFGRRYVDVSPVELTSEIIYQLGALDGICRAVGTTIAYVKPHGALYNTAAHDEGHATAVVSAIRAYNPELPLLGPSGSVLLRLAEQAGVAVVTEAFADRGYTPASTLVPRNQPGALLEDPGEIARRVLRLVHRGTVTATNGQDVPVPARSICVHGDTPGAVAIARAVRHELDDAGVHVQPFAGPDARRPFAP